MIAPFAFVLFTIASATTSSPTSSPTANPVPVTSSPTANPVPVTSSPTANPTSSPTSSPTGCPTSTTSPTMGPTSSPTANPVPATSSPTSSPTGCPTSTTSPTMGPTSTTNPTGAPTSMPTMCPTSSMAPTAMPTASPTATGSPTMSPTASMMPTASPTSMPTMSPTSSMAPTTTPTSMPTMSPTSSMAPTVSVTSSPTTPPTSGSSSSSDDSDDPCFAGTELVSLESGKQVALANVRVGDRVQVATSAGQTTFSDVVFVPHKANSKQSTFIELETSMGRTLKATPTHLIVSGKCGEAMNLVRAKDIAVGDCVKTVSGEDKILSKENIVGYGVYTVVTAEMSGYVVVNGIFASSFAQLHFLPNMYYNIHRALYNILPKELMGSDVMESINMGFYKVAASTLALATLRSSE